MKKAMLCLALALMTGCATTEFKQYEGRNVFEGQGGTRVTVEGIDIWENGEPPRKFQILGIINDVRPGGVIPMAQLKGDIAEKTKEAGGDAVIVLNNSSQLMGYVGNSTATSYGNTTYGSGVGVAARRNHSKYAVIKYLD